MNKSSSIFTPLTDATFLMAERARIYSLCFHLAMQIEIMDLEMASGRAEVSAALGAITALRMHLSQLYPSVHGCTTALLLCSEADNLGTVEWMESPTDMKQ